MNNFFDLIESFKANKSTALIYHDKKIRFDELYHKIKEVGGFLQSVGVRKKEKIAIGCIDPTEYIILFFSLIDIEAVPVLTNFRLPKKEIDRIIKLNNVKIYFKSLNEFDTIDSKCTDDLTRQTFIIYTSGSISSKGVSHTHNFIKYIFQTKPILHLGTYIVSSPLYHMNGLRNIVLNLLTKSSSVLMNKFETEEYCNLIKQYNIDTVNLFPNQVADLYLNKKVLDNLKIVAISSAPVSLEILKISKKVFPNAHVTISYGTTELGSRLFGNHPVLPTPMLSVGYPHKNINYRLTNSVLEIKHKNMMLGYTNNENNLTSDGYFITNDLFRIDENGFYYFLGRADNMFICKSDKIYPDIIEQIINNIPGVLMSCVVGIDDQYSKKPYAFVVAKNISEDIILEELRNHLTNNTCPRKIFFIDSFPVNTVGKIDKNKLIKDYKNVQR